MPDYPASPVVVIPDQPHRVTQRGNAARELEWKLSALSP